MRQWDTSLGDTTGNSRPLTVGSLFSGIGGFDLGLERAGMQIVWQCEIDERARSVLARHFPGVMVHEDVTTLGGDFERPDLICGGFPCQDLSVAGRRAGLAGERSGLGTSSIVSLVGSLPVGFSSRTSLAFYPARTGETLPSSFAGWSNSGTACAGGCLTLNTSEWPKDAAVCSLSDILEARDVPPKYFLSPRACRGILHRAEARGKKIPETLRATLGAAGEAPQSTPAA